MSVRDRTLPVVDYQRGGDACERRRLPRPRRRIREPSLVGVRLSDTRRKRSVRVEREARGRDVLRGRSRVRPPRPSDRSTRVEQRWFAHESTTAKQVPPGVDRRSARAARTGWKCSTCFSCDSQGHGDDCAHAGETARVMVLPRLSRRSRAALIQPTALEPQTFASSASSRKPRFFPLQRPRRCRGAPRARVTGRRNEP